MLYRQVNIYIRRFFSSNGRANNVLQELKDRTLLKIDGPDSSEFLQGLITNDINHLHKGPGSMFTMFLNIKGRVLCDSIIYKTGDTNSYLIECDCQAATSLAKHIKMYKVRRKIQLDTTEHKLYVLFSLNVCSAQTDVSHYDAIDGEYSKTAFPKNSNEMGTQNNLNIFRDARINNLGYRIITRATNEDMKSELNKIVKFRSCSDDEYKILRYTLGVGEGVNDLPPGNCFPLENNCDYLHGISFHKGCYLGQELTARTYHTGVIRKRLMPLHFTKVPTVLPENNVIVHENINLGKLRGTEGNVGLALLRVNQALDFANIKVGDGEATICRPQWWPIELPKEKINIQKE